MTGAECKMPQDMGKGNPGGGPDSAPLRRGGIPGAYLRGGTDANGPGAGGGAAG